MFETMYDAQGIGLAATQIDVHLRLVVIDLQDDENQPLVMINPEFETLTQEIDEMQEGCLSVPGVYEVVKRPNRVRLKALNRDGETYEMEPRDFWLFVFNTSVTISTENYLLTTCLA